MPRHFCARASRIDVIVSPYGGVSPDPRTPTNMTEAQSILAAMSEDTGVESQPIPAPGPPSTDGREVGVSLTYAVLVVVGVGLGGAALAERGTETRPKRTRTMRSACRTFTMSVKQVPRTPATPASSVQDGSGLLEGSGD